MIADTGVISKKTFKIYKKPILILSPKPTTSRTLDKWMFVYNKNAEKWLSSEEIGPTLDSVN